MNICTLGLILQSIKCNLQSLSELKVTFYVLPYCLSDYFSGTVLSKPPLKMMVISSSDITLMQSII